MWTIIPRNSGINFPSKQTQKSTGLAEDTGIQNDNTCILQITLVWKD